MKVQKLISMLEKEGKTSSEIADMLNVSQPMISQYKKSYNASLTVAIHVFKNHGVVLFPYDKKALEELSNENLNL